MILYSVKPTGVCALTVSPDFFPRKAFAQRRFVRDFALAWLAILGADDSVIKNLITFLNFDSRADFNCLAVSRFVNYGGFSD